MPHFAPRPNTTIPTVFKMIPRSIQTDRSRIYSISKTIFSSGFRSYTPFTCASPKPRLHLQPIAEPMYAGLKLLIEALTLRARFDYTQLALQDIPELR